MNRHRLIVDIPEGMPRPWLRLAHVARFAAPGMAAGIRRLDDWEFLIVLSGETWLEVAGGTGRMVLSTGSVALIPPGIGFDWGLEQHSHLAVHFDLHAATPPTVGAAVAYLPGSLTGGSARDIAVWKLRGGGMDTTVPFIRDGRQVVGWHQRFAPLVRLWARGGARRLDERLRASAILSAALADWLALGPGLGIQVPGAVGRVRAWIDGWSTALPGRPCDIPALARQCGLGVVAFRSAFRSITGQSPRKWIERQRIDAVLGMLADPRVPVADAARLAGFDDPFHFARVVRRVTGRPPSSLRRRLDA